MFSATLAPEPVSGVFARIHRTAHSLSPSLRQLADHVLRDAEAVLHQTITELATAAGVAEATVTRLCRRLEYAGFHAFKIALAADVTARRSPVVPAPADLGGLTTRFVQQAAQTLADTGRLISADEIDRVAHLIAAAPRVDLVGQGNSGLVAQYFAHRLMRLGRPAQAHTDPHIAAVGISTLPPLSLVVGISSSGSTIDTVQHLRLARARGVGTVALTHRPRSPITRYADAALYTATQEEPLTDAVLTTLTSQILVLEVLYAAVLALLPGAPGVLRTTAESVVEKKY